MPSNNWVQMEIAARAQKWEIATDMLNSLAMFEMLPALEKLGSTTRSMTVEHALEILFARGWTGSAQRIRWATAVVAAKSLPANRPADLPEEQVQDARTYLARFTPSGHGASPELKAAVMAAVGEGRIQGVTGQLAAVHSNGFFGSDPHRIYLADGMYHVLAALARTNMVNIMSMMRYNEGFHGDTAGRSDGSALCSAMDIQVYAGFRLNLINGENVENTIAGVVKVIDNLPHGLYGIGLTRPSTVAKGPPMPDNDVFLPMNGKDWPMYKWGFPYNNPTPQFKNRDAATAVNAALGRNPLAKIAQMFMDGPDHVHLHVWSASSA